MSMEVDLQALAEDVKFDKYVYGIKDVKTNKFFPPFLAETDSEALRLFSDMVLSGSPNENMLSKHPEDYDLFHLGCFDCVTGCHTGTGAIYLNRAQDVIDDYKRKHNSLFKTPQSPQEEGEICSS